MLARPKATTRPSISSVPPNAARNTHRDAASSNQLRLAQSRTRRSSLRSAIRLLQPLADLAEGRGGRVRVEVQLAAEPAQERLGPSLTVLQAEHEQGDDEHDAQAGERERHVQGVHPAQRDRDQQGDPEEQVEHDGGAQAGGGQGEAGVRAADARQREQPVAEGRAGRAAAGHDVAERLGAHLDAEHPQAGDLGAGLAERRAGQQGVGEPRRDLQDQAGDEERRADLGDLGGRAAEAGDQRQEDEVDDRREGDDLDGQSDRPEAGALEGARRVALDRGQLARLEGARPDHERVRFLRHHSHLASR